MEDEMEDWISRPLSVIEEHYSSGKLKDAVELLKSKSDSIPLVSGSALPPNGYLVRYRGMIQDQFDPEYYLKHFTVFNRSTGDKIKFNGMYKEKIDLPEGYEIDYDNTDNVTEELQVLYAVPIPGETHWIQSINGSGCGYGHAPTLSNDKKRLLDDNEGVESEMDTGEEQATHVPKKHRSTAPVANGNDVTTPPVLLNHPLPGETRPSCLIKVYSGGDASYLVNSIMEFTGIICTDPSLAQFNGVHNNDQEWTDPFALVTAAERQSHNPPPSLVPRLHCLFATPLPHSNPLLPLRLPKESLLASFDINMKHCRSVLLELLTGLCFGDQLVAEYLLIHLISSIHVRTEVLTLGKFSLNVSKCPKGFPNIVYEVINELVTKAHILPLSLSNLNSLQFIPFKDYSENRLHTGLLQLSDGTHLVIDELCMEQGKLDEKGVANITALGSLVQWQQLKYDFKFHTQSFNTDIPVLILSEGRSIINTDCHVPLSSSSSSFPSPSSLLSELAPDMLNQLRIYLTLCHFIEYHLEPDIQKSLEDDFVQMRRADPDNITGEVFHRLLSLARYIAVSNGEDTLSLDQWEHAKRLHSNRTIRL